MEKVRCCAGDLSLGSLIDTCSKVHDSSKIQHEGITRLLASIYRLTGVNFWQSAKHLNEKIEVDDRGKPTKLTALPFYFLISHATELLLKSALLKRGFSEQELREFGYLHNLDKLLTALMAKGVTVTAGTTSLVRQLSKQHQTQELRYTALVDDGKPTYLSPPG